MTFKKAVIQSYDMGHHRFENRLVRTSSELFILTILASKGEAHPYEIQQMLLKEIFKDRMVSLQEFHKIIDWAKKLIEGLERGSPPDLDNLEEETHQLFPQSMQHLGKLFIEGLRQNQQLRQELKVLLKEADEGLQLEEENERIWDSDTTIYQVMKELESEGLIKINRTEIHHGRGRKVYILTENGRCTAFETILRFGALFQAILPFITLVNPDGEGHPPSHQLKVLHLFERVLAKEDFNKFMSLLKDDSPLTHFLSNLFPFLFNDAILFPIIMGDYLSIEKINENLPSDSQRTAYKYLLLNRLKDCQKRIGEKIQELETEP